MTQASRTPAIPNRRTMMGLAFVMYDAGRMMGVSIVFLPRLCA